MSEPTSTLRGAAVGDKGAAVLADAPALLRAYSAFLALALLIVFNILFTPNFLTLGTFNANLTQVATIVIVAVGMTFLPVEKCAVG